MMEEPRLLKKVATQRLIGHLKGESPGPTLVFFGGIHGNERSGVTALEHVFNKIQADEITYNGSVYGIKGNLPALNVGKRFIDKDLNRLWTATTLDEIKKKIPKDRSIEETELIEIYDILSIILKEEEGPFYFIDYHTTSSKTLPFITINDALINRRFSKLFPVPIILGIEEYLEGPLLSYINEIGYVSLGFESGQHTEEVSIKNSIAFTWLALVFSGFIKKNEVSQFNNHFKQLQNSAQGDSKFYEIIYRHRITNNNAFTMMEGFKSFEKVDEGTPLAIENYDFINAEKDTIIFMPLYQEQGEEGFFLIHKIPWWALGLSAFLRRTRFSKLLHVLPGVSWANIDKESLMVNTKIAQFFTKAFFHLLGYRNRVLDKTHFIMSNREHTAKNAMYSNTWWYRITTSKAI